MLTRDARGPVKIKRASVFLHRTKNMKQEQWDDVFKKAYDMERRLGKEKALAYTGEIEDAHEDSASSADDDLIDPKYDDIPSN